MLPIPEQLRARLNNARDLIPESIEELNACHESFMFEIPDGRLKDMIMDGCGFADRVMEAGNFEIPGSVRELADNAIAKRKTPRRRSYWDR